MEFHPMGQPSSKDESNSISPSRFDYDIESKMMEPIGMP
jgi:hypothetical protein